MTSVVPAKFNDVKKLPGYPNQGRDRDIVNSGILDHSNLQIHGKGELACKIAPPVSAKLPERIYTHVSNAEAKELTKTTDSELVQEFTNAKPLSIARPLQKYGATSDVRGLPRHMDLHWRGLWHPETGRVYGKFSPDDELLPSIPTGSRRLEFEPWGGSVLCHCKPVDDSREPVGSESRYPDIPDRLDIYLLLRHQFDAIAFAGRKDAAIIRRTEATFSTILKLRDWEQDRSGGRYRRSRGQSQLRRSLGRQPTRTELERQHAKSALTHLGLEWPRKPTERYADWGQRLTALGLYVETCSDLAKIKHRATSTKMQERLSAK